MNGDRNRIAASVSMSVVGGAVSIARPQGRFEWGRFNRLITGVCFVLFGFAALAAPGYALAGPTKCASLQEQYRQNQEALNTIPGRHAACAKSLNPLKCNEGLDQEHQIDEEQKTRLTNEMKAISCPIPKS
jgi:hypothetical protein